MDINSNDENMDLCEVPRWQLIKSSLSNLDYKNFVETSALDGEEAVIIDVRTSEEFEPEHIEGAINLDYLCKDLADQLELLDKTKNYYIYCRTGRRSLRVCVLLRNLGFETVHNLEAGIVAK